MKKIFLLSMLIAFSACQNNTVTSEKEQQITQNQQVKTGSGMPDDALIMSVDVNLKNTSALHDEAVNAMMPIGVMLESPTLPNAQELAKIQEVVTQNQGKPFAFFLEQEIAFMIYHKAGITPAQTTSKSLSKTDLAALGFATELLKRNHNPNADFIYNGLQALAPYWTEAQIKDAAKAATNDAKAWMTQPQHDESLPKRSASLIKGIENLKEI